MSTNTDPQEIPAADAAAAEPRPLRRRMPSWFGAWETTLAVAVVVAVAVASLASPFFATGNNFSITFAGAIGLALMVIPMTWLMIAGDIDLSVASVFGLAGVVFGMAIEAGWGLAGAVVAALVLGAAAGLLNGVLVLAFDLPSLVVTIGTLGLFRGLAYVLLESRAISRLPVEFTSFAQGNVPGTYVPYTFVLFTAVLVIAGVVLHRGVLGRRIFAIGSNKTVARFSGIRVARVRLGLFVFSGTMAALAGMLFVGYVSSARANNGVGLELAVIAVVLIGGVSMYGGRGSITGVTLSLTLVTVLQSWMTLEFVRSNIQNIVIGVLMIAAVALPAVASIVRNRRSAPS